MPGKLAVSYLAQSWHDNPMLVIPVPKRLRQGYHKLDASFGYLVEPCLKNKTKYRIDFFLVLSLQSLHCGLEEEFDGQHQRTLQVLKKSCPGGAGLCRGPGLLDLS